MTSKLVIQPVDATTIRVAGELGFANADEGVARSNEVTSGSAAIGIDIGGIERPDSATLGVLLIWAARAAARGVRLRFTNVPDGLRALARLCDAEPLLGIA